MLRVIHIYTHARARAHTHTYTYIYIYIRLFSDGVIGITQTHGSKIS